MNERANRHSLRSRVWKLLGISCLFYFGTLELQLSAAAVPGVPVSDVRGRKNSAVTELKLSVAPTSQEISRARIFEDPLVPVGVEPSETDNAELAQALIEYSKRNGPDDFGSLIRWVENHPQSPWKASVLTGLGIEFYNTAHYSKALEAWREAWSLAKDAPSAPAKTVGDRAAGELAYMYARLGRMTELEGLLKSVEGRVFLGPATEKIAGAGEGLWMMLHRPEVSFRCGPLALLRIKLATDPLHPAMDIIHNSASTQKGFSLTQVAELSQKVGLNYQMAFRRSGGVVVVPSVVHWKVGHYAALVRREGERYLLQDPTFQNDVWATQQTLEDETSGYFLIPPGALPPGWRMVEAEEGNTVWGKGQTTSNDPKSHSKCDQQTGGSDPCDSACGDGPGGGAGSNGAGAGSSAGAGAGSRAGEAGEGAGAGTIPGHGLAVSRVHLMLVNLSLRDTPVGYSPPVGPPVQFEVRYNHREAFQPATFTYSNFGSKWTCDWLAYITDNPQSPSADVNYYLRGGGTRLFTGFDTNSQGFAPQQYDQTHLTRTGPASYEMLWPDGSKLVFRQSDGSVGTSRKIFLSQVLDAFGNTVTLSYDDSLRLLAITDAIGQVTTLTYGLTNDLYKVTRVTDPFGRYASFDYDTLGRLTNITDVIGLSSGFRYETNSDFINVLLTPYGTNTFIRADSGNTRVLETVYADGSRDRVEFNQTVTNIADVDPPASVPVGMGVTTQDGFLQYRNTYYWSRNACAQGYGDYAKAKIYHWLHSTDASTTSGILESSKQALEGRVWYDYPGQNSSLIVGSSSKPAHIGRVLDDGSTQLYSYTYDAFGHVTNTIDPVGRSFSYFYATNGIDLLEVRMTRAGKNELLSRMTYNVQHRPLTVVDAAGQTNTYNYNGRGQLLTATNPKNETTTYIYNTNGYLVAVDGPLPGTNDMVTAIYDSFGRVRVQADVSGYALIFDYDALDRITRITHPDSTFEQFTYYRLDAAVLQDRAGRQTLLEYNNLRQLGRITDPLNRTTFLQWCSCGDMKSLTDAMGRTTTWEKDVQSRLVRKVYGDGSKITYSYENTSSRLRQVTDENLQTITFSYNPDNSLKAIAYANNASPTPSVSYTYDPDYQRRSSMTDGTGTTLYSYVPITAPAALGARQLARADGPLSNDTITYSYDELGRLISTAVNGVSSAVTFDAGGRVVSETNALGSFNYSYDSASSRLSLEAFPNGQVTGFGYGSVVEDLSLHGITNRVGSTAVSEFLYSRDISANRIAAWAQQAGTQAHSIYSFSYDAANEVLSAAVTNGGLQINSFNYTYDPLGNRLIECANDITNFMNYNSLNQLSTGPSGSSRTNEWDAKDRLVAVNQGNQRTEFVYDGEGRLVSLRYRVNGSEVSYRRFVWRGNVLCEERDASDAVTKRFFAQGVKLESGPKAGSYFYTRDHLGSIREMTDSSGSVRARYQYDPFGRRTRVAGDLESDFGFAGMFWSSEANLAIARFRAYDPELGRWLSRDPLRNAESQQGPNLYAYAGNDPVNLVDPSGLCCESEKRNLQDLEELINRLCSAFKWAATHSSTELDAAEGCSEAREKYASTLASLASKYFICLATQCHKPKCGHFRCSAGPISPAIDGFNNSVPDQYIVPVVTCFWE